MGVIRYDGPTTGTDPLVVAIDVPDDQFCKVINSTGSSFTIYHETEPHQEIVAFDPGLTGQTVGSASDFTGELIVSTRVFLLGFGGAGNRTEIHRGSGADQYTHTPGTNVFTFGSAVRAVATGLSFEYNWVTQTGNVAVTGLTGSTSHDIGLQHIDHISIPVNGSVTLETGVNWRPGNK